jgi:hypothetical protein
MLPALLAAFAAWWWPVALSVAPSGTRCRPPGCLGRVEMFVPLVAVGLVASYPLAAAATAGIERAGLEGRWPFRASSTVAGAAVVAAVATAVLTGLAALRALFTVPLAWLAYTLAVPVFDAVLVAETVGGTQAEFDALVLALYPVAVVGQVAWWYGLGHLVDYCSTLTTRIRG